jgi:signal peptidase I
MADNKQDPRELRFWTRVWRGWVRPLVVVVIVVSTFRSAIADWNDVPTGSMNPTILEGDRIIVNKVAYDLRVPFTGIVVAQWSQPQRGQIITLWSPHDGTRLVKRVVAVEGDTVELRDGELIINGDMAAHVDHANVTSEPVHRVSELSNGKRRTIQFNEAQPTGRDFGPYTVPRGNVFVMGDNRDHSFDSRFFGPVPVEKVTGHVLAVGLSFDMVNHWDPRWSRFGKVLD